MSNIDSKFINPKTLEKYNIIGQIFDYSGLDLDQNTIDVYNYFKEEFEKLYQGYADIFGIKEYSFYLLNNTNCNASAIRDKGYNIIRITNGYPILITKKFSKEHFEDIIDNSSFANSELTPMFNRIGKRR